MKVIDISQEVFSCDVYPGDPVPRREVLQSMEEGELYNLSCFSMCAHNGTHVDAPAHFLREGKTVEQLPLEQMVGPCYVARCCGELSEGDARSILERAGKAGAAQRILIAGDATVTAEAAGVFAAASVKLVGCEGQSVGPVDAPMQVHLILLSAGVVLLEGIMLETVPEGRYFLFAAPLKLAGAEGSPCRACLIEE